MTCALILKMGKTSLVWKFFTGSDLIFLNNRRIFEYIPQKSNTVFMKIFQH